MKNKPTNQPTITSRDKKFDTMSHSSQTISFDDSLLLQSKFESWKKSINPPQTIHAPMANKYQNVHQLEDV